MSDTEVEITFEANLAGVNTAARPITFGLDGDAKISLETSGSEAAKVVSLLALGASPLLVTVRVLPGSVRSKKKKDT